MKNIEIGKYKKQKKGYEAFIPNPFPPREGFDFSNKIMKKNDKAIRFLGKLDGITQLLPNIDFFIFMYIRKDATSSSQIEGTRASLVNAVEAEANIKKDIPEDVSDILNYIKALNYGLERVKNFPFSLRFLRELHKELMERGRKTQFSDPGNFRKSQNWIGGKNIQEASHVPPPPEEIKKALDDLEKFLYDKDNNLPLIKAGLAHAQFETIHPFLDGNGRTGRMLITFYLWKEKLLEKPVLFLSSYFKRNQQTYYDRLSGYHNGKVEEWLGFFLDGVVEIANEAITTVHKITEIRDRDLMKIQSLSKRASKSAMDVFPNLYKFPIVDVAKVQDWTGFSRSGAKKVIDRFVDMGILKLRDPEKEYGRSYVYEDYMNIFT